MKWAENYSLSAAVEGFLYSLALPFAQVHSSYWLHFPAVEYVVAFRVGLP